MLCVRVRSAKAETFDKMNKVSENPSNQPTGTSHPVSVFLSFTLAHYPQQTQFVTFVSSGRNRHQPCLVFIRPCLCECVYGFANERCLRAKKVSDQTTDKIKKYTWFRSVFNLQKFSSSSPLFIELTNLITFLLVSNRCHLCVAGRRSHTIHQSAIAISLSVTC